VVQLGSGYRGKPYALGEIHIGLLADQVAVSPANTLYLGQGVHDLLLSVADPEVSIPT
jgi:hypothetical protein